MTRFVIDAPVAIQLAADRAQIAPDHELLAPTLLRSQALLYASVRQGTTDHRAAKKTLDGIRALRVRLLGDRVLQAHAWNIARALDWPDTYRAEYIALTRLKADALVTLDTELATAASSLVTVAALADLLTSPPEGRSGNRSAPNVLPRSFQLVGQRPLTVCSDLLEGARLAQPAIKFCPLIRQL